ncbi:MAG: proline--tRNA ligase, partial [Flavobacteriia bacterium]|nr:proline--tRNA ligase [Flavobacteriia bacterium]
VYTTFVEQFMAMPVIRGRKTESERFAGADDTYCIEAMMQDGKALQAGTSHFLGQNFAKAFDVKFADKEGKLDHVWATSWGVSTRLMGALIMTHSDDEVLVLPPALAPIQVVIVPIHRTEEELAAITEVVSAIQSDLRALGISVKFDDDDNRRPGWKFAEYEAKGVPVRLAVGPRDLANGVVEVARRDTKEKFAMNIEGIAGEIKQLLDAIQTNLYETSLARRTAGMHTVDTYEEFKTQLEAKGGFYLAHWDGTAETEEQVKKETQATIRCIPLDIPSEPGVCMVTGKPSAGRVVFAKAY